MSGTVLILRPEPGAAVTADRARLLGLQPIVAPLFTIIPLACSEADPGPVEAVLLTSANAARHGPSRYADLPCYAVGEATAAAARAAGYGAIRVGPSDGKAAAAMMAADGIRFALHPCGRDHVEIAVAGMTIRPLPVYAAEPAAALSDEARSALAKGALPLLHSPRAARQFASLVADRAGTTLVAISPAAAEAAGQGWAGKRIAKFPRDEALLELAVQLCQTGGESETG